MQPYADDDGVFIRSMASRGHAGGLASTSTAAAASLDAAGFELVLIETVGTGQSEVEVAAAADTTVVLEAPEMGDEVQAIKAGLLEVADIVVVNKGDQPGAQRTAAQLRAMLVATAPQRRRPDDGRIGRARSDRRSSSRPRRPATGVPELLAALDRHRRPAEAGAGSSARLARAETQVWAILADRFLATLRDPARRAATEAILRRGRRPPPGPVSPPPTGCRSLLDWGAAADDDRTGLRGRRRAHGPRHRPGPRGDRAAVRPLRAGPGARRGRPRPHRRATSTGRSRRAG